MLVKKLSISLISLGAAGGAGTGIYYSVRKNEDQISKENNEENSGPKEETPPINKNDKGTSDTGQVDKQQVSAVDQTPDPGSTIVTAPSTEKQQEQNPLGEANHEVSSTPLTTAPVNGDVNKERSASITTINNDELTSK